ncbi:MAG: FAD-binding protein [Alphaproteobacteria bacterium]|nr:FAD-binding protein [Alphaproteobacteria bacterium]
MSDFGGLIRKPIKGFTDDNAEAQAIIKRQEPLHPRGTGHSNMGQSIVKDATIFTPEVIDIVFDAESKTVYASAGATLLEIDHFLEPYGYMVATSPDHRSVSLGGVLSVGGYGVEVCRYGALVDNVVSLDLMYKDGRVVRNLPAHAPDAKKVLCGIGEHGVILAAKVKCIRKPIYSYIKSEDIPNVDHYVEKAWDYINDPNKDDNIDIWYAHWGSRHNKMSRGKMVYEENRDWKPPEEGYRKVSDFRALRKEKSDQWSFGKPYKYHIWLDHFFTMDHIKPAMERGLEVRQQIEDDGGEVIVYSSLGPTIKDKDSQHFPHYSESDYLMSVGIFANFLEEQEEAAKKCAKRHILYSKEMQEKHNARLYRYAWYWDKDFDEIDLSDIQL